MDPDRASMVRRRQVISSGAASVMLVLERNIVIRTKGGQYKIGMYSFCVYRGFYLLWSSVIVHHRLTVSVNPIFFVSMSSIETISAFRVAVPS